MQEKRFKTGDRVVPICRRHGATPDKPIGMRTYVTDVLFTTYSDDFGYKLFGSNFWYADEELVSEELYDSPLMEALR